DTDRLAALDQQGFVVTERAQGLEDAVVALPVAGGAADAAVDHQLARVLRHVRIQVVLDHPVGRLGEPGAAVELGAARGTDEAGRTLAQRAGRRRSGSGKTGSGL